MKTLPMLTIGLIGLSIPLLAGNAVTPEPSTALLMGGGLGVLILIGRKVRAGRK